MVIVNFLHYSVSRPSILFMGLVLLAPLLTSSHIVTQCCSYLVSCFGEIAGCAGMVKSVGPPTSTTVALQFIFLCLLISCQFLSLWFLVVCLEL